MDQQAPATIQEHFSAVTDPRVAGRTDHLLINIITIAICAVICGAESWVDVENYGKAKQAWLAGYLDLSKGIPSHDTFGRVFAMLNPEAFQRSFLSWMQAVFEVTSGQVVAIDGKQLRRSHDWANGKGAIHMVSAWAANNRLVLAQVKVDDKSNEITAIPKLLSVLELAGCIVTLDAMGTQQAIAAQIIDQGADYVLALKGNQGLIHEAIAELFDDARTNDFAYLDHDYLRTTNNDHGRMEIRQYWVTSDIDWLEQTTGKSPWPGLRSVGMVEAKRRIGQDVTSETRYFLSSLEADATLFAYAVRSHWHIENGLHWILDVAFREDDCRVRKGFAAQNFAVLRHIALNLLRQEKTAKCGVKAKRLKAAWDDNYLLKVLSV